MDNLPPKAYYNFELNTMVYHNKHIHCFLALMKSLQWFQLEEGEHRHPKLDHAFKT